MLTRVTNGRGRALLQRDERFRMRLERMDARGRSEPMQVARIGSVIRPDIEQTRRRRSAAGGA